MRVVSQAGVCPVGQCGQDPHTPVPSRQEDRFDSIPGCGTPVLAHNRSVARVRELMVAREDVRALALAERELTISPDEPELLVLFARLLVRTGGVDRALEPARRAYALADGSLAAEAAVVLAAAERYAGDGQRVEQLLRRAVALDPESALAHRGLAELVLPDFASPHRPAIERSFIAANGAYQAGDWRAVKSCAQQILALDENEGLAHALYATALEHMESRGVELLPELGADNGRNALVGELERILGGRLQVLLPDWDRLTELQRATVARSALAYGSVLPRLADRGLVIRLVPPGASATAVDPNIDPDFERNLGRYAYAGRGWQRHNLIVTGIEKLSEAARGGHDTLAHELAHALEAHMAELGLKQRIEGHLTPAEALLAETPAKVRRLFAQARETGAFLDAYSGRDEHEYFAQGMMAYLSPEGAARLRRSDPALFDCVREVIGALQSFPIVAPVIDHSF